MPNEKDEFGPDEKVGSRTEYVARIGIPWGMVLLFIGVALVVVFAVQNTNDAPVRFLWWEGAFPLAIVILGTAGLAVVLDELAGVAYRRRRRKRLAEKEELKKLRSERPPDD
jgi:uncharacterized integral membrane protein